MLSANRADPNDSGLPQRERRWSCVSLYHEIVSGRRSGLLAGMVRGLLRVLSLPYRTVVALRNGYYDLGLGTRFVARPCISVGNLTAGGTGKTPMVIWLASRLIADGAKVAVLSRGYRGKAGTNDELELVGTACPKAVCVANPDRVRAAELVLQEYTVDALLLDDGFQHRRLGRDLDIVLIDATQPFGYGRLLPGGLLREPIKQLARAHVVIITRASEAPLTSIENLQTTCATFAPHAPVLACNHRPVGLLDTEAHTADISHLAGVAVYSFAGVGNPLAFRSLLQSSAISIAGFESFPDHHHYTIEDCRALDDRAQQLGASALVTTEKDLIKLRRLPFHWSSALWALKIDIDFVGQGGKMLVRLVDQVLQEHRAEHGASPLPAD